MTIQFCEQFVFFIFFIFLWKCFNAVMISRSTILNLLSQFSGHVNLWSFIITEFSFAKLFGHKPKLQVFHSTSGLCCNE